MIITGENPFDLERELAGFIGRMRGTDPYAPVHVLVGSNLLGIHLKRALARMTAGLFNVRFLTFPDLLSSVELTAGYRPSPALPPLGDYVLADRTIADLSPHGCFGGISGTKGFAGAVLETFDDLSEACCTGGLALELAGSQPGSALHERVRVVLRLFAEYRGRLETAGWDLHRRYREAASAAGGATIAVYGFYDFNEAQWRLLEALGGSGGRVASFVPSAPGIDFDAYRRTVDRLRRLAGGSFPRRGGDSHATAAVSYFDAPDEEVESREVVRRILDTAGDTGIGFGDMAVLLPAAGVYEDLLAESFEEAGIPFYLWGRNPVGSSRAARGALQLVRMLGGRMGRAELVEFLETAPLRAPAVGDFDPFSFWVRRSAEEGMAGAGGWAAESAVLLERLSHALLKGSADERQLLAAKHVGGVVSRIAAEGGGFDAERAWSDISEAVSGLVRDLFEPCADTETVADLVASLGRLDGVCGPVPAGLFVRALELAVSAAGVAQGGFKSSGVNVLPLHLARCIPFRAVFIPGLVERRFPGRVRQDPFLRDDERETLAGLSNGALSFSMKRERLDEQRYLFALARRSASDRLVLSRPRCEEGTGRDLAPSAFLEDVEGYSSADDHREPLRASRVYALCDGLERALGGQEYDFLAAAGIDGKSARPPDNPFFRRGAAAIEQRWMRRRFTAHDGVFETPQARREIRLLLERRGSSFSATSLETYARCPLLFYFERLLGVETLEEPERLVTITPLQRGTIVHEILAALYGEYARRDLLPLGSHDPREILDIARRVVDGFLENYPRMGAVGIDAFWRNERRLIGEAVVDFVSGEAGAPDQFVPVRFEETFGEWRDAVKVPFETGGRRIFFHGRIDRLDVDERGGYRVIDYKTGRLEGKDQDMGGGRQLQLPVYLLAASAMLDRRVEDGVAEYVRIGSRGGRSRIRFLGGAWEETGEHFGRIVEVLVAGIESGVFPAIPDDRICRSCSCRIACSAGQGRIFERKARADRRVRPLLDQLGVAMEE